MKPVLIVVALAIISFQVSMSRAQSVSTEEIIQELSPSKTRSLQPNRGITVEGAEAEDINPSVNLYINFEYNSAVLKQDALITLDHLAAAISDDRLAKYDFLIGGHTDAVGSEAYNQALSELRAKAVKIYLEKKHSIARNRLVDKGFGEQRLLDPQRPLDGANRRVQVTTLVIPKQ